MGKYFGTDGFRGEANVGLTFDHAVKIGRFLGWYYGDISRQRLFFHAAAAVRLKPGDYDACFRLPVTYTEEITAVPAEQEIPETQNPGNRFGGRIIT